MSKPTVLLTGATGFLGGHLLEALLKQGYQVVVLKRSTSNLWRIEHLAGQYKSYDVDTQPIEEAFEDQRIDSVIHTASDYGRQNSSLSKVIEANVMFGVRVLDLALKFKAKVFINTDTFFNSGELLQEHLKVYTLSKRHFLQLLMQQSHSIKVINMKLNHIYGVLDDSSKFIPWILSQMKLNVLSIDLTKGEQLRDFIYVDDVVFAYLMVLEKSEIFSNFSEFNVGTGRLLSLRNFTQILKEEFETKFGKIQTKLNFGEKPYGVGEIMTVDTDISAIKSIGCSNFIDIRQGIRMLVQSLE